MSGADNKSMPATALFRDEYDRIFGEGRMPKRGAWVWRCGSCDGMQHEPDTLLSNCPRCGQHSYGSVDASIAPPLGAAAASEAIHDNVMVDRFYEGAVHKELDDHNQLRTIDIGSRKRHRDLMRERGWTTADDYKNQWAAAETERDKERRGDVRPDREMLNLIGKLDYEAEKKARRK